MMPVYPAEATAGTGTDDDNNNNKNNDVAVVLCENDRIH